MNISRKLACGLACLGALLSFSAYGDTTTRKGSDCPRGFIPSSINGVCQADNVYSDVVFEANTLGDCPEGFERPPGVRFCVASNMMLDIQDEQVLIAKLKWNDCPEGFHRPVGSRICIASNLLLDSGEDHAELVEDKRSSSTDGRNDKVLQVYTGPICPPGFMRPPGVRICVAQNVIYGSGDNADAPEGICPEGWYRPVGVRFCVPSNIILKSQVVEMTLKAAELCDECGEVQDDGWFAPPMCPEGTIEVWWDMPVYDEQGLFVIDFVPARACVPEDLEPAS